MKKVLCVILAVLLVGTLLQGCGSNNDGINTPQTSEASAPQASETNAPQPSEAEITGGPEHLITEETAYKGVRSYCQSEYGYDTERSDLPAYLELGTETESEYQVIFHSYTGALLYFYVEKASGATRMVEYVPALDIENEAGVFNLFDYLGKENAEAPSSEGSATGSADSASESQKHFVFQPKVSSVYMEEVFGKTMCETWYHLVDAVMAGEDTFACPDQHTYDWVMGQFPRLCFPVLTELIDYAWDRENSVINGVASFTYLVPREEAAARIEVFAVEIEGILNEALADDYSDFEKALALYDYFSRTYEYDYETYRKMYEAYVDYTTTYRLFKTGMGICSEIAPAYSYLLMQAGVDATIMMGDDHEWSYIRIDGHNYHIDPTFALSNRGSLSYFMMTDEQREVNGYSKDKYIITSNYSQDNPHPDYTADDDTFRALWDQEFKGFSHKEHIVFCLTQTFYGEQTCFEFDYTGY